MLYNLHVLRALAALAVVYYHITSEAGLNLPVSIGAHGVDVFFVISGFIISYTSARAPEHFFRRRVIRIVPFYWAASIALFGVALFLPHLLHSTRADVTQLLYSIVFIPRETEAGLFPTLVLGWSLNYEMYFYALFALALVASRRWAPVLCAGLIAAVLVAIDLSHTQYAAIRFYARPLVLEFVFGIAAYYLFRLITRSDRARSSSTAGQVVTWALLIGAACVLGLEEYHSGYGLPRFIAAGVPAFVLVTAVLVLEQRYGRSAQSRLGYLLGESSYILYLIHPYVIYAVLRVAVRGAREWSWPAEALLIALLMGACAAVAVAIHLWFEKPLLRFVRSRLDRRSATAPDRVAGAPLASVS